MGIKATRRAAKTRYFARHLHHHGGAQLTILVAGIRADDSAIPSSCAAHRAVVSGDRHHHRGIRPVHRACEAGAAVLLAWVSPLCTSTASSIDHFDQSMSFKA